jgi:hypothetical protein
MLNSEFVIFVKSLDTPQQDETQECVLCVPEYTLLYSLIISKSIRRSKQQSNKTKVTTMVVSTRQKKGACPPSPKTKLLQKAVERTYQQHAFNDLLLRRSLNNGQLKYGDFKKNVSEYQARGYKSVTRRNLHYRLELFLEKGVTELSTETLPITKNIFESQQTFVSNLTNEDDVGGDPVEDDGVDDATVDDATVDVDFNDVYIADVDDDEEELNNQQTNSEKTPGKRLTKKQKQEEHLQNLQLATTEAASNFYDAKTKTKKKLAVGTLNQIIAAAEVAYTLESGSIKRQTVLSRVKQNNLKGIIPQKISPLHEMEPLIIEWCERMAKIGMSLNRSNVIELVTDLIQETVYAKKLVAF